jgi:hypothetical protein
MISSYQINALNENELAYLFYCCNTEWNSLNMGYEFGLFAMKSFKNNTIHRLLDKYSTNLTEQNKTLIMEILKKLEANR